MPVSHISLVIFLFCTFVHAGWFPWSSGWFLPHSKAPNFPDPGFYEFPVGMPDGNLVGFADWNLDTYSDVFQYHDGRIGVSIWNHDTFSYTSFPNISAPEKEEPVQVIPIDMQGKGAIGILAQFNQSVYYLERGQDGEISHPILLNLPHVPVNALSTLDFNNDLKVDLISNVRINGTLQRMVFLNQGNLKFTPLAWSDPLASPYALIMADLNGDCLADLVTTNDKHQIQVYINERTSTYKDTPDHFITVPPTFFARSLSFGDFNGDGALDMIFVHQENGHSITVELLFNHQWPICANMWSKHCQSPETLCTKAPDFYMGDHWFYGDKESNETMTISLPLGAEWIQGGRLSVGDADLDGRADVLIPWKDGKGRVSISLYESVPCTDPLCSAQKTDAGLSTLVNRTQGVQFLHVQSNLKSAVFASLDELGKMDIFAQFENGTVSALVQGGPVNAYVQVRGTHGHSYDLSGPSMMGGTSKMSYIDLNGQRRRSISTQCQSTSYGALSWPSVSVGLGRVGAYVERMFYGTTIHQDKKRDAAPIAGPFWHAWIGIVTMSRLVVLPHPPLHSMHWRLELILSIADYFTGVVLGMLVALGFFGAIIVFLHQRERKSDEIQEERVLLF